MAVNATAVQAWVDAGGAAAYLSVRVAEGGTRGNVEYIGTVPVDDAWDAMTTAQKAAALKVAVKAVRDAQVGDPTDLNITGSITL